MTADPLQRMLVEFRLRGQHGFDFNRLYDRVERITTLSAPLTTPERFALFVQVRWQQAPPPPQAERLLFVRSVVPFVE